MGSVKICIFTLAAIFAYCSAESAETFELFEDLEIKRNDVTGKSGAGIEEKVADFMKVHDATFKLPIIGTEVTLQGKNLDQDEVDLKINFSDSTDVQARRRKSKLKKIFVPLFIIMLLKVITLIPLALGILGLKTWNALQLSFVTFIISISMAVYQLCKKVAADNAHPAIATHGPWEAHAARSLEDAHRMAYSAYTP